VQFDHVTGPERLPALRAVTLLSPSLNAPKGTYNAGAIGRGMVQIPAVSLDSHRAWDFYWRWRLVCRQAIQVFRVFVLSVRYPQNSPKRNLNDNAHMCGTKQHGSNVFITIHFATSEQMTSAGIFFVFKSKTVLSPK
jgi:hypothetical protein